MKILLSFLALTISSCSPKEQISVFDSSMLIRTSSETEEIKNEITSIRKECENNKYLIQNELNSISHNN